MKLFGENDQYPPPQEGDTEPFSPLPEEETRLTLISPEDSVQKWANCVFVECNEAISVEELTPREHADVLRALCRELQAPHPGLWDTRPHPDSLGSPLYLFAPTNQRALCEIIRYLRPALEKEVHEMLRAQRKTYSAIDFSDNLFTFVRMMEKCLVHMVYDPR